MRYYIKVIIMVSYKVMITPSRQDITEMEKNQHECHQKVKHRGNNILHVPLKYTHQT